MRSITKHNSLFSENAEKDPSLGQNMNHQKTTLAEIPIKGNVNNHPKPPAHSDTLVLVCRPAIPGIPVHKRAHAWKAARGKKKSEKNTRIILDRRAGAGNV